MYPIQNLPNELLLGRQREQNVTTFVFNISAWLEQWPGLVCHITHARGGEPYLVTGVLQVDNTLTWTVGGDCTQDRGYGSMVITGVVDDKHVCSACTVTWVLAGHALAGDPPAEIADWMAEAGAAEQNRKIAEAERARDWEALEPLLEGVDSLVVSVCGMRPVEGDVPLTGGDVPVSGADHTRISAALGGKMDTYNALTNEDLEEMLR